jgi:hypothetical protein
MSAADHPSAGRAEPDSENSELADMVAAMSTTSSHMTPPNGYRSGQNRTTPHRLTMSDRKLSLQERGSRGARQPTIETKRVSITDGEVNRPIRAQVFLLLWCVLDSLLQNIDWVYY